MPYRPKLTEESLETIVGRVRSGIPPKTVIQSMGIHRSTFYEWMRNGTDRPGSIYGAFREQITRAVAEADVIDHQILVNAKTKAARRITKVTRTEDRLGPDGEIVQLTSQTETVVDLPPDPRWAWEMLKARNPAYRPNQQINATITAVPHDVQARTIAERLRVLQGGQGPSLLAEGDDEVRELLEGP